MKFIINSLAVVLLTVLLTACGGQQTKDANADESTVPALTKLQEEHQLLKTEYADSVNAGLIEDTFKGSARREAKASIGGVYVTINYGSPGKRGRVLWNGLVAYNQVWVTGSHWATAVTFSAPVSIAGVDVPAGTYGFFTIPGESEWVLILNKEYDMHLAEGYNEAADVVRVSMRPEQNAEIVQRLTYSVVATDENDGGIVMQWDDVKVIMPFVVQ